MQLDLLYYRLTISNSRQAERHRQLLFVPFTTENHETQFAVSKSTTWQSEECFFKVKLIPVNARFVAFDHTVQAIQGFTAQIYGSLDTGNGLQSHGSCGMSIQSWCNVFLASKNTERFY